ncbi:MAG: hypothetical protein ABR547_08785 [Halanaerobium sp.]
MKKIIKNKKLLLIFLTALFLLILLTGYLKTSKIELLAFFEQENELNSRELPLETDKKVNNSKEAADQIVHSEASTDSKNENKIKPEEKEEIEKIALIKEIKDPFQAVEKPKNKAENFEEESVSAAAELKIDLKKDLLYLEKNIIAEKLSSETQKSEIIEQSNIKLDKNEDIEEKNQDQSLKNRESLEDIKLPFKLIGIIKNKENSSALLVYQGQTLLKKEKEKIDNFKIEKINNKDLLISSQGEQRRIHLWKEKYNEN